MTQGYLLSMVAYGIIITLLTKQLKSAYPDVTRPWYAVDTVSIGMYDNIELYFNFLKQYPGPPKSVLIVNPDNIETGNLFGLRHRFKVCTGIFYIYYKISIG